MIIKRIAQSVLITFMHSILLLASGGTKKALTAATACTIPTSQLASPLAALYQKRFPHGHDSQQWQEIITTIIPLKLIAAKKLVHDKIVRAVAWNPAGTHLATGSCDRKARIWDAQSGKLLHTLDHQDSVFAVAWHPAGTHLATGSYDNKARIWDAQSGKLLHTLDHQDSVFAVAWHPAGTHLATGSCDRKALIWDTATDQPVYTFEHNDWVRAVAWHPAGTHLATASDDNKACIWDAQSGKPLHILDHQDFVYAVAWHPAGTHLATGSYDNKALIWDIAHIADPKYQEEYNQLMAGTLDREKLMLIHVFAKQKNNTDQATLKEIADHARTKGMTVVQLIRTLLTLHPIIMHGILQHYVISLRKQLHKKDAVKFQDGATQESYSDSCEALKETLQTLEFAHSNDNIANVLGEYIVQEENYLDSYQALKAAQEVLPADFDAPVQNILGEYIV